MPRHRRSCNEESSEPAQIGRLHWLAPPDSDPDAFEATRQRLERIVSVEPKRRVYAANRRSICVVDDAVLGSVAIKEVRFSKWYSRLWFATVRRADALREFRVGSAFAARGGRTPRFFGAALEGGPLSLRRVLLFIRWIEGAETWTRYVERHAGRPPREVLERLAGLLVDSARLGFVHGRHSSENVLVDARGAAPELYTIDFAYSKLRERFDAGSFASDVARIAHWLWHEDLCDPAELERFFAAVAARGWDDAAERGRQRAAMERALERWKDWTRAKRQRFERTT